MHYHIDIWDRYGELMMQSTNLEWELVQDRVLAAYQHGNPLTLDGSTVSTYSISRIRILETDHEVNPMASYHDESLPEMGYAYTTEERDVTNRWITGPPGHGTSYAVDAADQSNSEDDSQGNFAVQRGDYSRPDAGTREVFVVHGRNSLARDALFEFPPIHRSSSFRVVRGGSFDKQSFAVYRRGLARCILAGARGYGPHVS